MARAAADTHQELRHGLVRLASIASTAPLVGFLGTSSAIACDTFRGLGTDQATGLGAVGEGLARACVPTAMGLLVGLQSLWCYRHLQGSLIGFDRDMENVSLQVRNQLIPHLGRRVQQAAFPAVTYLDSYSAAATADLRTRRRSARVAAGLLALAWLLQAVAAFGYDALPLGATTRAACRSLLITCLLAWVPSYAVWVDLLRRRPAALPAFASAVACAWCAVGLLCPEWRFW